MSPEAVAETPTRWQRWKNRQGLVWGMRTRQLRRKIVVFLRRLVRIDEDGVRDELVDELRKESAMLLDRLSLTMQALSFVNTRLAYYETHIPRMRELRRQFDNEQKKKAMETKAPDEARKAAFSDGILSHPDLMKGRPLQ